MTESYYDLTLDKQRTRAISDHHSKPTGCFSIVLRRPYSYANPGPRLGDEQRPQLARSSGFTAINRPPKPMLLNQDSIFELSSNMTNSDSDHGAGPALTHHLHVGEDVSNLPKRLDGHVITSDNMIPSHEAVNGIGKSSRKRRKALSPPTHTKPMKAAKIALGKSACDGMHKMSDFESGASKQQANPSSETIVAESTVPTQFAPFSQAYMPSGETMQRLNDWRYHDSEPAVNPSSDHENSDHSIRQLTMSTPVPSFHSSSAQLERSSDTLIHSGDFVAAPPFIFRPILPESSNTLSQQTCRSISRLASVETDLVEGAPTSELVDYSVRLSTINVHQEGTPMRSSDESIAQTENIYHSEEFDSLDDDDFLNLDDPESVRSLPPFHQGTSPNQSTSVHSVFNLPTLPSSPISVSFPRTDLEHELGITDSQSGWIPFGPKDDLDLLDLTDEMLDTSDFMSSGSPTTATVSARRPSTTFNQPHSSVQERCTSVCIGIPDTTVNCVQRVHHQPILRPPFPEPIPNRSPLIGVSANDCLRTCFRIGEAINAGYAAPRQDAQSTTTSSPPLILIELYAKVVSSHRAKDGVKQHFVLSDLFHEDRPPFIQGVYDCWKGSALWEYDCGRLLSDGEGRVEKKLCRAVGRMKRKGADWSFAILSIWEATWEDVEYVRDVVCS